MSDISNIFLYSDKSILQEIGKFIQSKRIEKRLTQDELAEKTTMSRSTISLIERGEGSTLANLIKLLRILDALYVLQEFKVIPKISPMQLAMEAQAEYKRVRKRKGEQPSSSDEDFEW